MIRNHEKIPAHLPKRLTISFPIWGLYDTESGGVYRDIDRMMIEHKERGFNCIRLDDGAGLMHDLAGNPRGAVSFGYVFGEHDKDVRQFGAIGEPGLCHPRERLIALFEAAKRHGIYIILSSWYYLHTCWFVKDKKLNDELHGIEPEERFMAFAKFLHYIISELEERGLDDRIAFAEIFNEADGLDFVNGYDEHNLSDRQIAVFRKKHEEAIEWLRNKHPEILFAYDSFTYYSDLRQIPSNMQVYNFHNYFLWANLYGNYLEKETSFLKSDAVSAEEIKSLSECDYPPPDGWYNRAWYYTNLDPRKISAAEQMMTEYLREHIEDFREKFRFSVEHLKNNLDNNLPAVPTVCGEGVTYSGGYKLLWEEKSEEYWTLVREMLKAYRELGLWGSVVRTCAGPEDPVWNLYPERLLEMNRIFLGEDS
jgi:hypothetical protein